MSTSRSRTVRTNSTRPHGLACPSRSSSRTPRSSEGPERAAEIIRNVSDRAADVGLEFNMDIALRANTLLAHRLIWFADQPGSGIEQAAMKERLLQAYFTDGLDIGDPAVLADCAADVGFDHDTVADFLRSDQGAARWRPNSTRPATRASPPYRPTSSTGKWAVPGAQEAETFAQVLRKMAGDATSATASAAD